jgi:hypothetical protein
MAKRPIIHPDKRGRRGPSAFHKRVMKKAVEAVLHARACGLPVAGVEFIKDGYRLMFGAAAETATRGGRDGTT